MVSAKHLPKRAWEAWEAWEGRAGPHFGPEAEQHLDLEAVKVAKNGRRKFCERPVLVFA